MPEMTFIVDSLSGEILAADDQDFRTDGFAFLEAALGDTQQTACARPLEILRPPDDFPGAASTDMMVRINGFYHNSLTEGPGRRSSVLFQFCPLKCRGCYVPHLHSAADGFSISVNRLADLLLDSNFERDGVSILGGEPFAQADALLALVKALRLRNCPHIVCYSGYVLEELRERAAGEPSIEDCLNEIDILIDGPFIRSLAGRAGLWTGSANQRVIDLVATGRNGQIELYPD